MRTWEHPSLSAGPAGAYLQHLATSASTTQEHRRWESSDGTMPSLFVSHGAPFTLDDPEWIAALFAWGLSMPKPRGIVVVSAHWESAPAAISATAAAAPLTYDFSGFHPLYKTLTYPTPSSAGLARRVIGALPSTTEVHEFADRGLDHGAYIPLMAMYPAADVPVLQLSMPSTTPGALVELGTRLRELRDEGFLIMGSGFMTHSFAAIRKPELTAHTRAFDTWANDALTRGDIDALTDYRTRGPGVEVAHPSPEHYVPLLLALGAATDPGSAQSAIERMVLGNSTRSVQLD